MARTPTGATRRSTALLLSLALLVGTALALSPPAAAAEPLPATVSADALPTVQVDGVVWDTVVVGDRVYATGSFAYARPAGAAPGQHRTRRSNVLAFDLVTGDLVPGWDPVLDGQGLALAASSDGSRVYVAGDFTRVDGTRRSRVAALDARTGELVHGFRADANARVRALAVRGETLYLGGIFTVVGGLGRTRLAAVQASTGRMTSWAPTADAEVMALTWPQGTRRIVAAGRFSTLNGTSARGMGALDAATGATGEWLATRTIQNYGDDSAVYSLSTQGSQVFGTAYDFYGPSNFEGSFAADAATGRLAWLTGCRGDHYDSAPADGVLYTVSHAHDCAAVGGNPETDPRRYQHAAATTTDASGVNHGGAFSGEPAPTLLLDWLPSLEPGSYTGQSQAAWSVSTGSGYVVLGGEFPEVNGTAQQGLVRFAPRPRAPLAEGPIGYAGIGPDLAATSPGSVRGTFTAAWDRDGHDLTYELLRGERYSTAQVVAREVLGSSWWDRPRTALVDPDAPPGTTATYRVRVTDRDGNAMVSRPASVRTAAGPATGSAYAQEVRTDSPRAYWRLGEPSGTTAYDAVGDDDLVLAGDAVRGAAGPLEGDAATTLPGSSPTQGHSSQARPAPETFALEAWLRTTSLRGGKVLGFGRSSTGVTRSGYDRHVYLTDAGRVVFGVAPPAGVRTVTSPGTYADGAWHHVVAQLGPAGMELYVDGGLVASQAGTTSAQPGLTGYWRLGGDNLAGWPSRPSGDAFAGSVDEVAVYPSPLAPDRVAAHARAGGARPPSEPTASFAAEVSDLSVGVDASASADPDGSVTSFAWDFGDGATAGGATAEHTYAVAGTYRVGLVVTDDGGLTSATEQDVTVVAPAPGPADGVVASDSFARPDTPTLGTAETGGPWTRTGDGSGARVADGVARVSAVPGRSATLGLPEVSAADVDLVQTLGLERSATGGGVYLAPLVRATDAGEYRARLRLRADGSVLLALQTRVGGADRFLTSQARVPGLSCAPGELLSVRVQATGTSPTRLRAKVWEAGSGEPSAWTQEVDDGTAQLQGPGSVGLWVYASGSMAAPALLRYDDVEASTG